MTDDLVKRLRLRMISDHTSWEASNRIEELESALHSIADTPIGYEIPDRTTIWGLAVHMQETAKYALLEGKDD